MLSAIKLREKNREEYLLTQRQLKYLSLVSLGFSNLEIARILCVTESSVKKVLEIICEKFNAKNKINARTYLITVAFIHRLLNTDIINKVCQKYNIDCNLSNNIEKFKFNKISN